MMKRTYKPHFGDLRPKKDDDFSKGLPEEVRRFRSFLHNDPIVILQNAKEKAEALLPSGALEEYMIEPLKKILADIDEAMKAHNERNHDFVAWKMYFIGSQISTFERQDFMQDGGVAINRTFARHTGLKQMANKEKIEGRHKLILARDKRNLEDIESLTAWASAKKMIEYIKTYDRENEIEYKASNYLGAIYREVVKARKKLNYGPVRKPKTA